MRLIDADKLRKEFEFCDSDGNFIAFDSLDKASDLWFEIDEQPTIDAVEVVGCKDCKYGSKAVYGGIYCKYFEVCMSYNDFCSYGERKDGKQE